jgi:hypothetical protein
MLVVIVDNLVEEGYLTRQGEAVLSSVAAIRQQDPELSGRDAVKLLNKVRRQL